MVIATGAKVSINYVEEVTRNVTPTTPSMLTLRTTGRNINLVKNILESAEVRGSRQRKEMRHGLRSVTGSIPFELSRKNYDDWIYYILGDKQATTGPVVWVAQPAIVDGISTTSGSPTADITRATGSWITDGWRPGFSIEIVGSVTNTGNNARWTVVEVTSATVIKVADPDGTIVTEAASVMDSVASSYVESGDVLNTLSIERAFADAVQFQTFRGCALNGMSLSIQPEAIVGGTFDILGMSAKAVSGTAEDASPTVVTDSAPFDAFSGILVVGPAALPLNQTAITGLDFSIVNGRTVAGVIGSTTSPDIFEGQHLVTGTLTAFFEDAVLLNQFINETPVSIGVRLDDANGNDFHSIAMNNVKYTGADMDPPAEGPVPISFPFQALESTTDSVDSTIAWQKSGL